MMHGQKNIKFLLSVCLLIMLDTFLRGPSLHCKHFTTFHHTSLLWRSEKPFDPRFTFRPDLFASSLSDPFLVHRHRIECCKCEDGAKLYQRGFSPRLIPNQPEKLSSETFDNSHAVVPCWVNQFMPTKGVGTRTPQLRSTRPLRCQSGRLCEVEVGS
jgi:hypothetical protein